MNKHYLPIAIATTAALLQACGGGNSTGPNSTTAKATPSLGKIFNANVEARCLPTNEALGSGSTGTTGLANFVMTGSCSGPVMLLLTSTASSTYFDEKNNADTAMPANTVLRAISPTFTPGSLLSIAISPLTEIATQRALNLAGGTLSAITTEQASAANTAVSTALFGAADGLNILTPPTLLDSGSANGSLGSTAADRYAFYLAAIAALGQGATPALSAAFSLAEDFATDGDLDGTTNSGVAYEGGSQFMTNSLQPAMNSMIHYANSSLQQDLNLQESGSGGSVEPGGSTEVPGSGNSGNTFPNEQITLPAERKPALGQANNIVADDLSTLIGSYTGNSATTKTSTGSDTASSCTVVVASNGNITVTAGGVSVSQNPVGTTASYLQPSSVAKAGWSVGANPGAGKNVPVVELNINRHKLSYAYGYIVEDTSQVPANFTHEVKCWIGDNRAPGTATESAMADTDTQAANASEFPINTVGIYNGWIWSDNGSSNVTVVSGVGYVAKDANKTCSVTVGSDGTLRFDAQNTTLPVTNKAAKIAGDYIGGSTGDRVKTVDDAWNILQAHDYISAADGTRREITMNAATGIATLNEGTKTNTQSWSCKIPTTPTPAQ